MSGWEVQSPPEGSPGWHGAPGPRGEDASVWETSSLVAVDGGEGGAESHGRFVLAPAAPAHHATVVAGPKGQVTAHTGGQERQGNKRHPPEAKLLVASVARAGVCIVALGVRHTVIEQAVRTPHTAHPADASSHGVGRVLAAAPPVLLVVEHVPAVLAPGALAVLLPPPGFAPRGLGLDHAAPAPFGVLTEAEVRGVHVGVVIVVLGDLALGEAHVGVRVLGGVQGLAHGRVPVVLVARHPDLLPGVDAHDLLVVVREAHLAVGPGHRLPQEKRDSILQQWQKREKRIQHVPFTLTKAFLEETDPSCND